MPEPVEAWWARRQFSTGRDIPYAVGAYRDVWTFYPALVRQYHPEFNAGLTLSQIPPAADVWLLWQCEAGHLFAATPSEQRMRHGRERRRSSWCPECLGLARPGRPRSRRAQNLCAKTPELAAGESFVSACAPAPASAVEAQLRHDLAARLDVTFDHTAVRVARPFFDHLEVWPDIVIPELRVAVEYDSSGRHGLEHVGRRELADLRKDRALRAAHWEVVRLRASRLPALGPYDLQIGGTGPKTIARLLDRFREIRGALIVEAYRR